jgi:UDP-N-acetylmuramoyl-tripeptide--D-alanyl-D-alanine ligase
MDALFIFTGAAFYIWTIRNIVSWTLLWQEKNYSWRRLYFHLKDTAKGKSILFSPLSIIKWVAVLLYFYTVFEEKYVFFFQLVVVSIYITQALFVMKNIYRERGRRPDLNREAMIVIMLCIFVIGIIFAFPLLDKYFWVLFLDRITALVVSFFVFVIAFPIELIQDNEITRAMKKMKIQKDMMTIGIVGSYGKSSTKEFLYQLLSKKYKVVKTKGHHNTLAEIAKTIIKNLKKSTQIFIVEMNDFSKGDIRKIAEVVSPNIGIITGINPQYLSSFKTIKESVASKAELIEALPKKSLILFNGSDKEIKKLYDEDKKTKRLYFLDKNKPIADGESSIYAENKKITKDAISFEMMLTGRKVKLTAPLIGAHNIENLLPAVYIADYLGMRINDIKKAVSSLKPPENTMVRIENDSGIILLDDTSNTNPESVFAALEYMKLFRKKKIVVMQTMTELGKEANAMHKKIARQIAEQCETLFITNSDYLKLITTTVEKSRTNCKIYHLSKEKIVEYINENTKKGDIILFEGYESKEVLELLL